MQEWLWTIIDLQAFSLYKECNLKKEGMRMKKCWIIITISVLLAGCGVKVSEEDVNGVWELKQGPLFVQLTFHEDNKYSCSVNLEQSKLRSAGESKSEIFAKATNFRGIGKTGSWVLSGKRLTLVEGRNPNLKFEFDISHFDENEMGLNVYGNKCRFDRATN
jgi:hypothetical protein